MPCSNLRTAPDGAERQSGDGVLRNGGAASPAPAAESHLLAWRGNRFLARVRRVPFVPPGPVQTSQRWVDQVNPACGASARADPLQRVGLKLVYRLSAADDSGVGGCSPLRDLPGRGGGVVRFSVSPSLLRFSASVGSPAAGLSSDILPFHRRGSPAKRRRAAASKLWLQPSRVLAPAAVPEQMPHLRLNASPEAPAVRTSLVCLAAALFVSVQRTHP